jgi:hypothetical protein
MTSRHSVDTSYTKATVHFYSYPRDISWHWRCEEPLIFMMQQEGKKIIGSDIHRLIGLAAESDRDLT